jgi:hypothetical protein
MGMVCRNFYTGSVCRDSLWGHNFSGKKAITIVEELEDYPN